MTDWSFTTKNLMTSIFRQKTKKPLLPLYAKLIRVLKWFNHSFTSLIQSSEIDKKGKLSRKVLVVMLNSFQHLNLFSWDAEMNSAWQSETFLRYWNIPKSQDSMTKWEFWRCWNIPTLRDSMTKWDILEMLKHPDASGQSDKMQSITLLPNKFRRL